MKISESIYKKFSQLSVRTGNRLTSHYKRIYKIEIGYSILLTTTGFHRHSAHGAGGLSSPNSTQPTSSGRKRSGAHRQLAFSID